VADNSAFRPRPQYYDPRLAAGAHAGLRASDADRERLVELLKTAFAEGRLSQDEYNLRMGHAYTARTYGELGALVSDLPGAMPRAAYGYPAQPPKANSMAVASLVCGILEIFFGFTAIPAVILGHKALRQIRQTGEPGRGMARAGLVLGWTAIGIFVVLIALGVLGAMVVTTHTGTVGPHSFGGGAQLMPLIRHAPAPPPGG
jgi:hypothetical protein